MEWRMKKKSIPIFELYTNKERIQYSEDLKRIIGRHSNIDPVQWYSVSIIRTIWKWYIWPEDEQPYIFIPLWLFSISIWFMMKKVEELI